MIKTKYVVLLLVCAVIAFTGCGKTENPDNGGNFDAAVQFTKDTTAIRAYIIGKNIPAVKDPKTGIFYQIIAPGSGNVTYYGYSAITVNYTGNLLDGTVFDSSNGNPVTFKPLGSLIPAWQIGISLIQPGGKIRLIVPSGLAYGNSSNSSIPANSNLDFTIDLIKVM